MKTENKSEIRKGQRVGYYNLFGILLTGRVEVVGQEIGIRLPPPEDSEGMPNDELVWVNPNNIVDPKTAPAWRRTNRPVVVA